MPRSTRDAFFAARFVSCVAPAASVSPWRRSGITGTTWTFSLLVVVLYAYLIVTLNSDVHEFSYGVPTTAHILMLLMGINVVVGLAVVFFAVRHWLTSAGGLIGRVRYSCVAIAALINVWVGWYFNILSYPFQ